MTENNFVQYAMRNYSNPHCKGIEEFQEDLDRFKYLKRLFSRYKQNGELKERLILNHLIVLCNVFGVEAATHMLFFKIEQDFWSPLKTFMVFLNYLPTEVIGEPGKNHTIDDIPLDLEIVTVLRKV